jgi:hypothetical protein
MRKLTWGERFLLPTVLAAIVFAASKPIAFAAPGAGDASQPVPTLPSYGKLPDSPDIKIPLVQSNLPVGLTLPASLSSTLPTTVAMPTGYDATNPPKPLTTNFVFKTQQAMDLFAWKTFIALNWPALTNTSQYGKPNTNTPIGQALDSPRVWETFIAPELVFLTNGASPGPYQQTSARPKNINSIGKRVHLLNENDEAFFNLKKPLPPIIDNNKYYARYEIVLNEAMYHYIKSNNLYNLEGQKAFVGTDGKRNKIDPPWGVMELKVAWRKLLKHEDHSRYFTQKVDVVENPYVQPPATTTTKTGQLYGLIGMHIIYKVKDYPQWIWPTFEHVDNAPVADLRQLAKGNTNQVIGDWKWVGTNWTYAPLTKNYSFFNRRMTGYDNNLSIGGFNPISRAAMEKISPRKTKPKDYSYYTEQTNRIPSQITRVITGNNAIVASRWTAGLNATMQNLLTNGMPNSPWGNYRLMTTQRPVNPEFSKKLTSKSSVTVRAGNPAPVSIGNPVAETYMQINGSCISCHAGASLGFDVVSGGSTNKPYSNFSFMFQRASSTNLPSSTASTKTK